MKRHIPNLLTCLNLLSGCLGIIFALQGEFTQVAVCVGLSGLFDLLDGMSARLLKVASPLGIQLDSLADMVSFGLLPGMIYYHLLQQNQISALEGYLPYAGFVVTAFSALRLAKFNIDERQSTDFLGLNTPMNTFYVISLPFIAVHWPGVILHPAFILASIALTSWLLVSEIRLFSLKFQGLGWGENRYKFMFLISAVLLLLTIQWLAIPLILILYFGFSIMHFQSPTPNKSATP